MTRAAWLASAGVTGRAVFLVAVLVLTPAGCAKRAPPRETRPDVKAEVRRVDAALDRLEERLLADQARVEFWSELQERHESVSEVTCKNLGEHAEAMARRAPARRLERVSKTSDRLAAHAPARAPNAP